MVYQNHDLTSECEPLNHHHGINMQYDNEVCVINKKLTHFFAFKSEIFVNEDGIRSSLLHLSV